ncbi:MAG: 2-O-methyltransferase NoeI [Verrucomicrobiota bacterium]|jgi:FkbM family methyltransferase
MFNILEILPPFGKIQVIDVGAMDLGGEIYDPLVKAGIASVLGFECVQAECDKLNAMARESRAYLPYAIGDGTVRAFHECNFPMTSSLLEPNSGLLDRFQNLENLTQVVKKHTFATKRLDDIAEITGVDFLKLDVQGAELDVMNGGDRVLAEALVVHTEVEFVEMYKGQPLFAEVDQRLRRSGFVFHKFAGVAGRTFKPMVVNNDVNHCLSQMLWADAVYVKDFMALDRLPAEKLLRLAAILHMVYGSFDLAMQALLAYDRQYSSALAPAYLHRLTLGK